MTTSDRPKISLDWYPDYAIKPDTYRLLKNYILYKYQKVYMMIKAFRKGPKAHNNAFYFCKQIVWSVFHGLMYGPFWCRYKHTCHCIHSCIPTRYHTIPMPKLAVDAILCRELSQLFFLRFRFSSSGRSSVDWSEHSSSNISRYDPDCIRSDPDLLFSYFFTRRQN